MKSALSFLLLLDLAGCTSVPTPSSADRLLESHAVGQQESGERAGSAAAEPGVAPEAAAVATDAPNAGFALPAGRKSNDDLDGKIALARLAERRGSEADAARLYRALAEENPKDYRCQHRLGVLAARQGRFDEARPHFEKALRLAPRDVALLTDYGYACYLEHRLAEAERLLRTALKEQPRHEAALNNLGLVLGAQERYEESLELFQQCNEPGQALANQAYVLMQHGRLDEAERCYSKALEADPNLRPAALALVHLAEIADRQPTLAEVTATGADHAPTPAEPVRTASTRRPAAHKPGLVIAPPQADQDLPRSGPAPAPPDEVR